MLIAVLAAALFVVSAATGGSAADSCTASIFLQLSSSLEGMGVLLQEVINLWMGLDKVS